MEIKLPDNSKEIPQNFQEFERKLAKVANNVLYELTFNNTKSRFKIVKSMNFDENKKITQSIFDSGEYYVNAYSNIVQNLKTLEGRKYIVDYEVVAIENKEQKPQKEIGFGNMVTRAAKTLPEKKPKATN